MNKLAANLSLYIITFFAAVQYVFLSNVPDSVSTFAFLAVTNLIGFIITLAAFFRELARLDRKQITQALLLSLELLGFNVFLLLGSRGISATVVGGVLSSYFAFIVLLSFFFTHKKPEGNKIVAVIIVLVGVFLMMNADFAGLLNKNILFLVISDVFFALYLLTAERFASSSNPSILAMGQTLFNCVAATIAWGIECVITKTRMTLPMEPSFWGSVFFISFFIRGLYGIVQIYAQRYVSPLNVSLIFSTEIIMTMAVSPLLATYFGTEPDEITVLRVIGAVIMMIGILIADNTVVDAFTRRFKHDKVPAKN